MRKNKTFTIATIVSIIGLALLGVGTYLGHSFISGGEMNNDIIYAACVVAISAILLSILIKARKAENDLTKWKIFEYLMLAVYLAFAAIAGYLGGAGHLVEIMTHKTELRQMAKSDVAYINDVIENYSHYENIAIESTCKGLTNSIAYGSTRTDDLNDFFFTDSIIPTKDGIESYKNLLKEELLGDDFNEIIYLGTAALDSIQQTIDSWNLLKLPVQAKRLEAVASEICSELEELREDYVYNLPKIESTYYGYDITGYYTEDDSYELVGGLSFYNAISRDKKLGATAWAVIVLLNFLILLPYLTTRRTTVLRNRITENDGGIIIKRN